MHSHNKNSNSLSLASVFKFQYDNCYHAKINKLGNTFPFAHDDGKKTKKTTLLGWNIRFRFKGNLSEYWDMMFWKGKGNNMIHLYWLMCKWEIYK